jgi:flagellin-like protein
MQFKQLLADEDAVSPVIGVILMVAITVILAAVIGTFVLGLGGNVNSAPQASWTFEQSSGIQVDAIHEGGDQIDGSNLDPVVTGTCSAGSVSSTLTAGSSFTAATGCSSGNEVRLVWSSPNSDDSNTLATYTVS